MRNKIKAPRLSYILIGIVSLAAVNLSCAARPKFTITPSIPGSNVIQLQINGTAIIQYLVTNQTRITRTLTSVPSQGISQISLGNTGECSSPFTLQRGASCTLNLRIEGSQIPAQVTGGPIVCKTKGGGNNSPDPFRCSQPSRKDQLNISVIQSNSVTLAIAGTIILTNKLQSFLQLLVPFPFSPTILTFGSTTLSSTASFSSYSCTPLPNGTALCIAVGSEASSSLLAGKTPILYQSMNGGATWNKMAINGAPTSGQFNTSTCITTASNARCVATGLDNTTNKPFIAETLDNGTSWNTANIPTMPTGILKFSSCSANGTTSLCIAAGTDTATGAPLLLQSAGNWAPIPYPPSNNIDFNGGTCTSYASSIRCIAVGTSYGAPHIEESLDGGATWNNVPTSIASGSLKDASCTPELCVAVGTDTTGGTQKPLLLHTVGIVNWIVQNSIVGLPATGSFNAASCISAAPGSGTCAIAGASGVTSNSPGSPLLAQTINNAANWNVVSISGLPGSGVYNTVSCSLIPGSNMCMAMGDDLDTGVPLLVETLDGNITWTRSNTLSTLFKYPTA